MPNNGTPEIWRTLPYPVEGRKINPANLVSEIGFDFCNSFVKEKRRESHHRHGIPTNSNMFFNYGNTNFKLTKTKKK